MLGGKKEKKRKIKKKEFNDFVRVMNTISLHLLWSE